MSVITPVLNCANTLELTLSSIVAQTYPNVEHIVVDGGSSDGTVDILRRFQSAVRLRWLSEPDTGMYAAVNKGLRLADGEILCYLNADDLYFPWSVDQAVSALLSSAADLVFGDLLVLVKRRGRGRHVRMQFYPRFRPRVYAYEVNMGQPTVFWRRRVSDTLGGFDERLRYCGDFEFWLRAGTTGFQYTHVREALALAVEHEGALATVHADELRQEIERTRDAYRSTVRERKFVGLWVWMRLIHWRWQVLLLRLNLRRDHPSSWANLVQFLKQAGMDFHGSSSLRLLLPLPLPGSWRIWRLDPAEFEGMLIQSIHDRCSAV